jgi:hypothetical protein
MKKAAPSGPSDKEVQALMLRKLEESGLAEPTLIKQHGYTSMTRLAASKLGVAPAFAGFKIPYYDADGKPLKFWRYRYLEDTRGAFARNTDAKPLRYIQPKSTGTELYLSPLLDWRAAQKDANVSLWITEGELKAACGCLFGYAVVGLGGVWCFKSTRSSQMLVDAFKAFAWEGRRVYVCYDSDAASNVQVLKAETALCHELCMIGADPCVVRLPPKPDGHKNGLDDFLVERGGAALQALCEQATSFSEARELHQLNEEVTYVRDPGLVVRLDTMQRLAPQAFTSHAYADRFVVRTVTDTNGNSKLVRQPAAKLWIQWPGRAAVQRMTYAPGQAQMAEEDGTACLNTWPGWGCPSVEGDVTPWKDLMGYLFQRLSPEHQRWVERWLAYPIQHPGTKLYSAVVVWGRVQGTGKSLLGYCMKRVYGGNFAEIRDQDLQGSFNGWAVGRQFVMGDEISGGDKRGSADRMKAMITQEQLRVNVKFVPEYSIPDCINYYFTSNHPDAFFLEDTDRRFFIHEAPSVPRPAEWYREFVRWLNGPGGPALRYHLEHLDLGDFAPEDHAPCTESKLEMIMDSQSDLGAWVRMLMDDPDSVLRAGGVTIPYRVWSPAELLKLYDPEGSKKVTVPGLGRELKRAGVPYLGRGRTAEGKVSLWGIRPLPLSRVKGPWGWSEEPPTQNAAGKIHDEERALPVGKAGRTNGCKY